MVRCVDDEAASPPRGSLRRRTYLTALGIALSTLIGRARAASARAEHCRSPDDPGYGGLPAAPAADTPAADADANAGYGAGGYGG